MLTSELQDACIRILRRELLPATGCTEPIAVAYAAARLRGLLDAAPERILAEVSGNILKNVKSVVVPNTGGRKGIQTAIAAGIVAGKWENKLEVLASVDASRYGEIAAYCDRTPIQISCPEDTRLLDIRLTGWAGSHAASVRIVDTHTNIVRLEKDGQVLYDQPPSGAADDASGQEALTLRKILTFAEEVDLTLMEDLLERQIACNSAVAEEGLKNAWGAGIGAMLLEYYGNDIKNEARAWAAAGSDARMSGCEMPVIIVSGSGNQGMTASLPVIRYAKHLGASREKLYRALLVSDLVTVYQKAGIGRLSAYCGAVSAGVGAGAGIAYLQGADYAAIAHTIVNAVAILSGMICDGAKPSCAAKIAASVGAGILGYEMCRNGRNFCDGDGIIGPDIDCTVHNVGVLARQGMGVTDRTILQIMTQSQKGKRFC